MKKIFLIFFHCALLCSASFAQIRKIPANVTDRFAQQYPMATSIEWRDKLTGYTAAFSLNDSSYTAFYNNDGDWTSTEKVIDEEELPETVQESFSKSKYAEWERGPVYQLLFPGGQVQYRLQAIKNEIRKRNLYFDPSGKMLRDLATL